MSKHPDSNLDLDIALIEKMQGKMRLLQPQAEREDLVERTLVEILNAGSFPKLKEKYRHSAERKIFVKDFLSYGVITDLLCDITVEDIIINNLNPIYVHSSDRGFVSTHKRFSSQKEVDVFIDKILLFGGKQGLQKIVNLELPNLEGRVNIAVSPFGPQITITKTKVTPLSILDLVRSGSLSYEVAAQLWIYIEGLSIRPANMMIAGGPGVGKTTLLNALFAFIPDTDRMVVIEDTLELNTFLEESCSRLESDEDLTLADLVKNSLRMRPERIVVGEVRGIEARDMITACNVGKYCIGTIHALTSREALIRLQNEPMNIPEMLVSLIDVFIVLKRYHVQGKIFRVVDEVSETSGMEQVKILLSHVYKYNYETNETKMVNPSTVYRDRLSQQSGLTAREIMKEHALRAFLLEQLDKKNMTTTKEVATFCRHYSNDPNAACAALGFDRNELLEKSTNF